MTQETTPQAVQICDLSAKLHQDNSIFSDFETKFISEQAERIEQYGAGTRFSEKQIALIEKIHVEKVRGERPPAVEKLKNETALAQLKELSANLANHSFSDFENDLLAGLISRSQIEGDSMTFSVKQAAIVERVHAVKIRGEKPKTK